MEIKQRIKCIGLEGGDGDWLRLHVVVLDEKDRPIGDQCCVHVYKPTDIKAIVLGTIFEMRLKG